MYIFLDVDGVLNTEEDWKRRKYSLNNACVTAFCRLLSCLHEPKVILSSTWRNGIARDGTTAVHIDDLLKALEPAGIMFLDKTGIAPDELYPVAFRNNDITNAFQPDGIGYERRVLPYA